MDQRLRGLMELAREQGWRIEEKGLRLAWFPPDTTQSPVFTGSRLDTGGDRVLENVLSQLRRAGLRINGEEAKRVPKDSGKPAPEPPDTFVRDLAELMEQEIDRRTGNLQDQVTALRNENTDLRQRLADAEAGVEERAREAALNAVNKMLADRRVTR